MELIDLLRNILRTKNQIKGLIGENDNLSRYSITIHNLLADEYNRGFRQGYHERCLALTGTDFWPVGPENYLQYDIDDTHYDKYTTEVLTDISRDVLNYKLNIKDEIDAYSGEDIGLLWEEYPIYLGGVINSVFNLGVEAGTLAADDDYEGAGDVEDPVLSYSNNKFSITTTQTEAIIYYKLGTDGIERVYTGPVIISDTCDVYYYAKIGRSLSQTLQQTCTWDSNGLVAFVSPVNINQEGKYITLSTSTDYANIEYKIDNNPWDNYVGRFVIDDGASVIQARAYRDNEYSKISSQPIRTDFDATVPANVQCSIVDTGQTREITLTCATPGATIYYAINGSTEGYYHTYTTVVSTEELNFVVFAYSVLNGVESKNRLVYKYYDNDDSNIPQDVQFSDQGDFVMLYTMTDGATISYRFGAYGDFVHTNLSSVNLYPSNNVVIYAFSQKNGRTSYNITSYRFVTQDDALNRPAKPTMTIDSNKVVHIDSEYSVLYTTNNTDPKANGLNYNPNVGVPIEQFTTVRAVAKRGEQYSSEAIASFNPFSDLDITGPGSGGIIPGGGDNPNPGGGDSGDEWGEGGSMNSEYFWFTGATGMSADKSFSFRVGESGQWQPSGGSGISGLDANKTYYVKGNLSKVLKFNGRAKVGGNVFSLVRADGATTPSIEGLFNGCTGLVNATKLRIPYTGVLSNSCMRRTFYLCEDLEYAPASFDFTDIGQYSLYQTFGECNKLKGGPDFMFNNIDTYGCYGMFENCGKMESCGRFDIDSIGPNSMSRTFKGCSSLYGIYLKTKASNNKSLDSTFADCFSNCISLNSNSSTIELNYTTLGNSTYKNMFYNCTSLTSFGNLPAPALADSCYYSMFEGCSSLVLFGVINATALAKSALSRMFYGCSQLEYAPELSCTNLFGYDGCYKEMFCNCLRLKYIKAMFIGNPSGGNYTGNWVKNVATSGTFVQNADATWTYVGPNGIPVGWSVEKAKPVGKIKDISLKNGLVYITASNKDNIYYSITDEPSKDLSIMTLYSEPFMLSGTSYINAVCQNEDGVWGEVLSVQLELKLPGIVISCSDNTVKIYTPYDFEYDYFQYQLYEYNEPTMISNWQEGDSFTIDKSYTVKARGSKGGNFSDVYTADIVFGLNAPAIEFRKNAAGQIWCAISYPNKNLNPDLYYKVNDLVVGDPPTGWTKYNESFKINDYLSDENPKCVIMAIARIMVDGEYVWSSPSAQQHDKESSVSLPIPRLRQIAGTNNVILVIDDVDYPNWDKTSIQIQYRYWGESAREYSHTINMVENKDLYSSRDVDMYVRACSGNITTKWNPANDELPYEFYFDNTLIHFDIADPLINVVDNTSTNTSKLYITNSTKYQNYDTINYFRIEVIDYTQEIPINPSNYHNNYEQFSEGGFLELNRAIVKCIIYAKTQIKDDWSNEVSKEWTNPFAITEIPAPTTTYAQKLNDGTYKLYITNPNNYITDIQKFYMLDDPAPKWAASGTVKEYKYTLADPEAPYTVGRYGLTIDQDLGYGVFRCWYEYAGLTSDTFDFTFINNDVVTVLYPPEINIARNDTLKLYVLTLTNNYNRNVNLQFRITNPTWSGGVVDVNKYADWKNCFLYGESLSEYLISGTIEARTYISADKISEVSTLEFSNTFVEVLSGPQINVIKENNKAVLTVTNKNKKATNFFRVTSAVWDGWETETESHKYDDWKTPKLYGQEIDSHLVSGTIEAFSRYGNEISDITTEDYVSDNVINSDPPTIVVTKNDDGETYTVTITNNAWVSSSATQYYPRVCWHIINCVWSGEQGGPDENAYIDELGVVDWLFMQGFQQTYVKTINQYLLSGTIEAFATDATNDLQILRGDCHKTAITSIEWIADDYLENNQG